MQQFAVVDDKAAYMPLQGFTTADLADRPHLLGAGELAAAGSGVVVIIV